jgi:hypothetical protein
VLAKRTLTIAALALATAWAAPVAALDHAGSQTGTWAAADSPHVVTGDVQVPAGQGLVIEAGSVVLMNPGVAFNVDGTLIANGADGAPIALVSRELRPGAGDWAGVSIGPSGAAWLTEAQVSHAVTGVSVADGGSLDAQGLTVTESMTDGIVLAPQALGSLISCVLDRNEGAGLRIEGGAPLVENCTMRMNDVPLRVAANAFPTLVNVEAARNRSIDGVWIDTNDPVTGFGSWMNGGLPWVVPDGDILRVESGAVLGLDGGAVLQFGTGSGLAVSGTLTASGNGGGDVIFTSLLDDEAMGDTNRDGELSSPSKGDWRGIDVEDGGVASFTSIELRHADDGLRVFPGGGVVLLDAEIHSTAGRGLALGVGTSALVQDSLFHDNDTGIQVNDTNNVAIGLVPGNDPPGGNNSFHCNASFDIENGSAFVLQAYRNYWGTAPPDISRFLGNVDTGEYLIEAPAAALARGCLALGREGASDLRFDWSEMSSCARYQLASATRPDGIFGAFTSPTVDETHLEPGAATAIGTPVRYFRLNSDFEGQLTLP